VTESDDNKNSQSIVPSGPDGLLQRESSLVGRGLDDLSRLEGMKHDGLTHCLHCGLTKSLWREWPDCVKERWEYLLTAPFGLHLGRIELTSSGGLLASGIFNPNIPIYVEECLALDPKVLSEILGAD
jgi:hypothetical protein